MGYILPAEFGAADTAAQTVTFKTTVPDAVVQSVTAILPGRWIRVTAPMNQPSETAIVATIEASERPQQTPKSSEKPQESQQKSSSK